nr:capsid protein [Totiviridae sp.]
MNKKEFTVDAHLRTCAVFGQLIADGMRPDSSTEVVDGVSIRWIKPKGAVVPPCECKSSFISQPDGTVGLVPSAADKTVNDIVYVIDKDVPDTEDQKLVVTPKHETPVVVSKPALITDAIIRPGTSSPQPGTSKSSFNKGSHSGEDKHSRLTVSTNHIGKHSVIPVDSVRTIIHNTPYDIHQNVVRQMRAMLVAEPTLIQRGIDQIVCLSNEVHGPGHGAASRVYRFDLAFPHLVLPANAPLVTTITFGGAQQIDILSVAALGDFYNMGSIATSKVQQALQSKGRWNVEWVRYLSGQLDTARTRYDTSALFTIGTLMVIMMDDYAVRNIVPEYAPAQDGDVVYYNFSVAPAAVDLLDDIARAMVEGVIFLPVDSFTLAELICLRLICIGPRALTTVRPVMQHIYSTFVTPRINFVLYGFIPAVMPAIAAVTATNMWTTLVKIASLTNREDMLVLGYVRAASYGYGHLVNTIEPEIIDRRYYNATLEVSSFIVSKPTGHNFLWNMLNIEPAMPDTSSFKDEYDCLTSVTIGQVVMIPAMIATLITTGASAFFKYFNITGRELNGYFTVNANPSKVLLTAFMKAPINARTCKFFNSASSWISQVSKIVINPRCIASTTWNGIGMGLGGVPDELAWAGAWNTNIPHLALIFNVVWVLEKWPLSWGLFGPGTVFDVSKEMVVNSAGFNGWYSKLGTEEYDELVSKRRPFVEIIYPLCALNAMKQHHDVANGWLGSTRPWTAGANQCMAMPVVNADPPWNWNPVFKVMNPYNARTYDWNTAMQLELVLLPARIGAGVYTAISRTGLTTSQAVGLDLRKTQDTPQYSFDAASMAELCSGFDLDMPPLQAPMYRSSASDKPDTKN